MDLEVLLRVNLLASPQPLCHEISNPLIHHHPHSLPQFLPLLLELIIAEILTPAFPHLLCHDPHLQAA